MTHFVNLAFRSGESYELAVRDPHYEVTITEIPDVDALRAIQLDDPEASAEDVEALKSYAPWSPEQVQQLNAFQVMGTFDPFTCPHRKQHLADGKTYGHLLTAYPDGWHCPVRDCDWIQDWAWISMLDPRNLEPTQLTKQYSNPREYGCNCVLLQKGGAGSWSVQMWNRTCKVHTQLAGTRFDTPDYRLSKEQIARANDEIDTMTAEIFDEAVKAGTPVEVDVQLKKQDEECVDGA